MDTILDRVQDIETIYLEDGLPRGRPAYIFCGNDEGVFVLQACQRQGIEVLGFVDILKSEPFCGLPCYDFEACRALDLSGCVLICSFRGHDKYLPHLEACGFAKTVTAHLIAEADAHRRQTDHRLEPGQINDAMISLAPHPQHDVDIFGGDWLCQLPLPDVRAGWAPLFDDPRVKWAVEKLGPIDGMDVLELGPYEGGHTYQLEKVHNAGRLTAVEANPRAFLRCLIVKNLFEMDRTRFLLGNFIQYLDKVDRRFDLIFASGVLYHQARPMEFLRQCAEKTDRLFLWTHFYDDEHIESNAHLSWRFAHDRDETRSIDGFEYKTRCFHYADGTQSTNHLGGLQESVHWLYRDDIVEALKRFGFTSVETGLYDWKHLYGPNLCIAARR